MRPRLEEFGITRLAEQTGLDRIGIPTVSAIRPNGVMISAHQGKGTNLTQALVSAIMEGVEVAVAERPRRAEVRASGAELAASGRAHFPAQRLMGVENDVRGWVSAASLVDESAILVPWAVVGYSDPNPGVVQTTNGLASGNCREEALAHAVCELVETDAEAIFSALQKYRRFDPNDLGDIVVSELISRILAVDTEVVLLDLTTDIDIPVVMAVLASKCGAFPTVYGLGCNLSPGAAARAAVLEAAQSRVTNIAGSRDDFLPSEYARAKRQGVHWPTLPFNAAPPAARYPAPPTLAMQSEIIVGRLYARGCNLVVVTLAVDKDFVVLRALSDDLEDRGVNPRWRPGRRAFAALRGAL